MLGDYSIGDLGSILAMQGFAGLILFSVYVLMALGLAIIFGQMGVINMAHGEFMILGAYVTWMTASLVEAYLPSLFSGYFFLAMALAFVASLGPGLNNAIIAIVGDVSTAWRFATFNRPSAVYQPDQPTDAAASSAPEAKTGNRYRSWTRVGSA